MKNLKKFKKRIVTDKTTKWIVTLYTGIVLITSIFLFISTQTTTSSAKTIDENKDESFTKLEGESQTIEYGEAFQLEKSFDLSDEKLANSHITINNLNTHQLGTSEVEVQFVKEKQIITGIIQVTVVDSKAPTISFTENDLSFEEGENFDLLKGVTATDNVDGNLTDKITVKEEEDSYQPGTHSILYIVKDTSGNITEEKRRLHITKKEVAKPIDSQEETELKEYFSEKVLEETPEKNEQVNTSNDKVKNASDYKSSGIAQPGQTLKINDQIIPYQNGGQGSGQAIIDSNPGAAVSTWGGAATQSGADGSNTHFIGHNPGIFSILLGVGLGQEIKVSDSNNILTTYIVNDIRQTDESGVELGSGQDLWDLIVGSDGGERITLQTCLSDTERLLIFAQKN